MAKNSSTDDSLETETKEEKKTKKKAKSVGNENEGEITKPETKSKKQKRKKAKNSAENDEEDVPKKSKKRQSDVVEKANDADEDVEDEKSSKKEKGPSKRQLKKERKEAKEAEKRDASKLEAMNKALSYVSTWKHARSQWKFEKLKQIWLMDHLLDDKSVPDDIFPTVLEYFEGCKGMARETLLKKGMDVIKKCELQQQQQEASEEEAVPESVEYKRARELLQALPTET